MVAGVGVLLKRTRAAALAVVLLCSTLAAGEPETLKIGVFPQPPFVLADDGGYTGMAVELWERAAAGVGAKSEYGVYPTMKDLLAALENGEADVGVGDITVTYERARRVKFSFPWYDAGMRIMVKPPVETGVWHELKQSRRFQVYLLFFLILCALALLMTMVRRRHDAEFPKDMGVGYTQALLDVTSSVRSGEFEQSYLGWMGHILSALWMFFGLAMVAYVTSTMTTAMTTANLDRDGIYGLGDLLGKKVGVLRGGVTGGYLRALKIDVVECRDLADASARLESGRVRAVVTDAPVLEYWAFTNPDKGFRVVGDLFHPDKFAFAANKRHTPLMDRVSVELIRMQEDGGLEALRRKYFGDMEGRLIEESE